MIRPNENPLTPASLATDGMQGAGAKTVSPSRAKHTPHAAEVRILALSGLDGVRALLARYALMTDTPALGMVEAADLLDAARAAMDGTP